MGWEKFENKKKVDKISLFVKLDLTHLSYSFATGKLFELENKNAIYHVNGDDYEMKIELVNEKIEGSFAIFPKADSSIFRSSLSGLLTKYNWLKSIASSKDPSDRKFPLKKDGNCLLLQLYPSFEHKIDRSKINEIPSDAKGIYRYIHDNEIVYIGIGNIKKRAQVSERKNWEFDSIEYSRLTEKSPQLRWETFFLTKEKKKNGKLPRYNKIA